MLSDYLRLTVDQIKNLKKTNLSKDSEKTRSRVESDFKAAEPNVKNEIVGLSGITRASFYLVFKSGAASARVIIPMALTLGVSPYYYTGAENEKSELTDGAFERFLTEIGRADLIGKQKRRYNKKSPETDTVAVSDKYENGFKPAEPEKRPEPVSDDFRKTMLKQSDQEETIFLSIELSDSEKMRAAMKNLDADCESAAILLKSLAKRAEVGGDAEMLYDIVKRCLLS